MRERRKQVEMWRQGNASVLATLVRVEGSSYRKVGARLMVAADGTYVGSISGGCLEAEITRRAHWLVQNGACVQRYSTAVDDTADIPYGLGCGGSIDVLLEPAGTPAFELLLSALERSLRGEPTVVRTRLPVKGHGLVRSIEERDTASQVDALTGDLFEERLKPPPRLLVFGAGDDAQPLVSIAALLGWRVVVVDRRAQWARPERFPEAERVLVAEESASSDLSIQRDDLTVVMTHSYEQDRDWLKRLLPIQPQYVGLLGARHRSALLVTELATTLQWPLERVCAQLCTPVGLDLGGDGAEPIALAIVAEMQALIGGRSPRSQRMTFDAIEEQIALGAVAGQAQMQCAM